MSTFYQSVKDPASALSLAELHFSDLMLWPDGNAYLRHVVGYTQPIIPVPAQCANDVQMILGILHKRSDSAAEFFLSHDDIPYRTTRIQTINGERYFLRRLRYPVPQLETLGLPPAISKALREIGRSPKGMVLVAGATGSGKTTTLYSFLSDLAHNHGDITVAVEDPPEIPMPEICGPAEQGLWYQVDAHQVGGYEAAMIAAMRYNPRYILLGEVRAPAVAHAAIRAAVNGHLVLSTIHASSLVSAIMAMQQISAVGVGSLELARSILADGLSAILYQELVRDPTNPGRRILKVDGLFLGNEHGIRAKIRSGKLEQLSTEIELQRACIERGESPFREG